MDIDLNAEDLYVECSYFWGYGGWLYGPKWKFYRLDIEFLDLDDILMGLGVDFMDLEWTLPGLNEYFTDLDCAFTDPECLHNGPRWNLGWRYGISFAKSIIVNGMRNRNMHMRRVAHFDVHQLTISVEWDR